MPTAERIRDYAGSPLAFLEDLIIPGVRGPVRFSDAWADFQRKEFAALAPALLAVASGTKPAIGRYWWERTKGASKDSDLACCLLWLLAFSRRPLSCQVGAADQDQAAELRKAAADILRLNFWLSQRVTVQNWRIVATATDSVVEIVASDTAGSHGARPDVLVLNELSHVTKEEFASNLMDNAAKVPHGLVIVATNAGFLDTFQHRWREIARTSDRWHYHEFTRPAPWLDAAEIEEAKARNSLSRYMRLFFGRWAANSGDALDPEDIEAALTLSGPMSRRPTEDGWDFVAGLDIGTRRDNSALVVLGARFGSPRIRLCECQSWAPRPGGRVDLTEVYRAVLASHQRFRFRLFYDPSQAEFMAQQFQRRHIVSDAVPFVGQNMDRMANTLLQTFRARTIDLFDEPALIRDLGRLNIEEKAYGYRLSASRDVDGHADRGIALSIALPAAAELAHRRAFDHEPMRAMSTLATRVVSRSMRGVYGGGFRANTTQRDLDRFDRD